MDPITSTDPTRRTRHRRWKRVRARLKEPSTWAGIAALGATLGLYQPEIAQLVGQTAGAAKSVGVLPAILSGLAGLAAILMKERGNNH